MRSDQKGPRSGPTLQKRKTTVASDMHGGRSGRPGRRAGAERLRTGNRPNASAHRSDQSGAWSHLTSQSVVLIRWRIHGENYTLVGGIMPPLVHASIAQIRD